MSKLGKLQKILCENDIDAILITSEINQRYITTFPFTDGYVLVKKSGDKGELLTDFRYIEAARAAAGKYFNVTMPKSKMSQALAELLSGVEANGRKPVIAFEDATLPVSDYEELVETYDNVEFYMGGSRILDGMREFKDAEEIEIIAKAQNITDMAFTNILGKINADMTEQELALELEFTMRRAGAERCAFDTITVSGSASALPHGVPRPIKLQKGFLTMDFGANFDGYCSDMTRTVILGKADDEIKRIYNTVLEAQEAALAFVCEGVSCREADKVARAVIDGAGYKGCFGHGLGHGVGMYIHEAPRLSGFAPEDAVLKPGHIVTVEPGIYIGGKYGCRIEDMIAITENGVRNFTHSKKELTELDIFG